jgi:hypothetical protein
VLTLSGVSGQGVEEAMVALLRTIRETRADPTAVSAEAAYAP